MDRQTVDEKIKSIFDDYCHNQLAVKVIEKSLHEIISEHAEIRIEELRHRV